MSCLPRDVCAGVYFPGSRLVQYSVKLRNVPGAMAEVAVCLSNEAVPVVSGFHRAEAGCTEALWCFVADHKDAQITPEGLVEKLRSLNNVLGVEYFEAVFDGLIVDESHFPLLAFGERSIILRVDSWCDMTRRLFETFKTGAVPILFNMGLTAGEGKAKAVMGRYKVNPQVALRIIMAERVAKGWGMPKIEKLEEKPLKATITVKDLFECHSTEFSGKQPRSHFFRGYLTGVFKQLYGGPVRVTEVKCVGAGDSECQFQIDQL